jgi:hypothetical protein
LRDRIARRAANWILVNVASFDYLRCLYEVVQRGLRSFAEEAQAEVGNDGMTSAQRAELADSYNSGIGNKTLSQAEKDARYEYVQSRALARASQHYTPATGEIRDAYVYLDKGRTKLARAEFDRWLTEHDRETAAKAWDEGYDAGETHGRMPSMYPVTTNPYRKEADR